MSDISFTYDRHEVEKEEFDLLNKGWYSAVIEDAEYKKTKKAMQDETGKTKGLMVVVKYKLEGNDDGNDGRLVWANLNIENDSETAQEIGRKQLNDLLHAVDIEKFTSPDQLKSKPVDIFVKVRKASGEFDARNEVSMVKPPKGGLDTEGFAF